jgi:hypothetical protein
MLVPNLVFVWLNSRELIHPRALARWMETSSSIAKARAKARKIISSRRKASQTSVGPELQSARAINFQ